MTTHTTPETPNAARLSAQQRAVLEACQQHGALLVFWNTWDKSDVRVLRQLVKLGYLSSVQHRNSDWITGLGPHTEYDLTTLGKLALDSIRDQDALTKWNASVSGKAAHRE